MSANASLETTPKTTDILERFEQRFAIMDSLIFNTSPSMPNPATAGLDSASLCFDIYERVEAVDDVVKANISEMKSRTGLDFRGQVYVRPGSGVSYDPDDPLVAYNAKFQAELEWNIFHSSIYKRASKIKELQLQGELRQLNYALADLDETIILQRKIVRDRHFGRMLSLLDVHAENVQLLLETQLYLLEHGKISSDDLLKLINEQSEIERQLIAIRNDSVVEPIPAWTDIAYITVVDTAGIFQSMVNNNIELKKLGIRHELLEVQRHNIDYVQTMDILPFVRYSYYNRDHVPNTYNVDIGVSFKIPISRQTSRRRRALEAEQEVIRYEQEQLENETSKGIQLLVRELESYNDHIRGEYKRMLNLKNYLGMRTWSYANVDGEYSRLNRLTEYNAYLQSWERLLEYVYQRDSRLIQLQSYLIAEPITNFIVFQELSSNP